MEHNTLECSHICDDCRYINRSELDQPCFRCMFKKECGWESINH